MDEHFPIRLSKLLKHFNREKESNTPDYILTRFLVSCLDAFDTAVTSRTKWYESTTASEWLTYDKVEDAATERIWQMYGRDVPGTRDLVGVLNMDEARLDARILLSASGITRILEENRVARLQTGRDP